MGTFRPPQPPISPLVRAALRVSDLGRSRAFYEALGFTEVYFEGALDAAVAPALLGVDAGARVSCAILKTPGQPNFGMVGLFRIDEPKPVARPGGSGGFRVGEAALVFYVADIDAALTAALLCGGTRVSGPLLFVMPHRAQHEAMVRDPDGVLINLVGRPPAESFGYAAVRAQP
ncbi:MAG: VOC family protein [Pseudomonadota bacterium]|jgi:catechol 2,3-dioxygenase-like lactoylglutathione lyase family enzyme